VLSLTGFCATPPRYHMEQERALEWLAQVHARAEAALADLGEPEREQFEARIARALARVGDDAALRAIGDEVADLCRSFPIYTERTGV